MNTTDLEDVWDRRELGADETFAAVADDLGDAFLDAASETTMISIRMSKEMIAWLKLIGQRNKGLKYQTLMKQVLARFIESEQKIILSEMIAEEQKQANGNVQQAPKRAVG